jgi:hypothetical protein
MVSEELLLLEERSLNKVKLLLREMHTINFTQGQSDKSAWYCCLEHCLLILNA